MNGSSGLDMRWEWLSAPTVKAAELRATWARLEIHVGGETITLVEDQESGSSRRSIYTSLYPLAEWVAFNWWVLRADARPAAAFSSLRNFGSTQWSDLAHRYQRRHGFRGVGDGFTWPDLYLLPEGRTTRIVWRADRQVTDERAIRFLTSGEATVDSGLLQHQLAGLVEAVVERISEQQVGETPLVTEWDAVQSADDDEAAFCLAVARLGLDPYAEADRYQADILDAARELEDGELLGDFLDVVDADKITATLAWIAQARAEMREMDSPPSELYTALDTGARDMARWAEQRPWERGWNQARAVRQAMGVGPDDAFRVEEFVRSIVRPLGGRAPGVQALGGAFEGRAMRLVLSRQQAATAERFTLARGVWHVLWQDCAAFLVTSAHTDRQRTERAFAAELLAPACGIAARIADEGVPIGVAEPELDEIAEHYGVSTLLVQHQLENQVLAMR